MSENVPEGTAVALVTGAGHGIGLEVVRQLAGSGLRTVLTTRDEEAAAAAAEPLAAEGLPVQGMALDVTSPESIDGLAGRLRAEIGRLDVLVNNAAGFVDWSETATTADLDASRALFATNLFGTWAVTQALLPLLRESAHPRVVNVASGAGSHGDQQFGLTTNQGATASYGISKAAINALTSKLAAELEPTPVMFRVPGADGDGSRHGGHGGAPDPRRGGERGVGGRAAR